MTDLPSGTVTFLFTDIEGSTERWEHDRAAMAEAVERYLALLRQAIETHGGVPFKVVGDAVQAAFGSPASRRRRPGRPTDSAHRGLGGAGAASRADGAACRRS